ncbi:MAG: hypothetical protein ACRDD7_07695 [Peptostreptococcaceae bacterium]
MEKSLYEQILSDLVNKVDGVNDETWSEIIEKYELNIHPDSLRKGFNVSLFSGYNVYKHMIDKVREDYAKEDMEKLMEKEFEVLKKTKRANTLYNFVHKKARDEERVDMWYERIIESIENMSEMSFPKPLPVVHNDVDGVAIFTDTHFGKRILIKGLNGEILNEYNDEIFKIRMWHLMEDIIDVVNKENLSHIYVMALADYIDGILHMSQLQSLQYGIVDSVVKYSEIIAQWLNELSGHVKITYAQCDDGNHDTLRVMTGKKGDFPHENTGKLISEFIKVRLNGNENITFLDSKNDMIYENICGVNVLGYHGEDKNLTKALADFEALYNVDIDLVFAGHLHSSSLEGAGKAAYGDKECIRIPSICGADDYAVSIKKNSSAGAKMFIFEQGKGKTITYDFWLN